MTRPARPRLSLELLADPKRQQRLAIAALVVLPVLMYLPLSLAGHPVLPGDDLNQNFPLRVLAGAVLRSGRLPAWDPFIWSGTPLLAGWNAGAMFPGTWLFAFIPAIASWTINLIAVPVMCSIGTFALARRLRASVLGAFLGALVFTYTGFMAGQVVHLGLTQGTALMPFMLLGVDGLSFSRDRLEQLSYGLLLAAAVGLCILAADPRAVSSAAIAVGIYILACSLRMRTDAWKLLARCVVSGALGIGLAALQWVPGLSFLHSSQRSQSAYSFFGAGSVGIGHLASLMTVPFLLGGNGNFNLPVYAGNYNLPELTVGAGFIALVAFIYYLPDLLASTALFLRIPQRSRLGTFANRFVARSELGVWYVMALVGLILTLGTTTPIGHLLVHVPLFNGERLQNRNAVLFDLALALFVAFFVDDWSGRRSARTTRRQLTQLLSWSALHRLLMLVPMLIGIGSVIAAFTVPLRVENDLHVPFTSPGLFVPFRGYLIATLALAFVIGVVIAARDRINEKWRRGAIALLIFLDVAMFISQGDYVSTPSSVLGSTTPLSSTVAKMIGPTGRFAIYNPAQELNDTPDNTLVSAGVTDLNLIQHNDSVQGYGSIVNGIYQEATNTHTFEDLNLTRLSGVSFNTLDLRVLFSLPIYFGEQLAPRQPVPLANGKVVGPTGLATDAPPGTVLPPYFASDQNASSRAGANYSLASPSALRRVDVYLPSPTLLAHTLDVETIAANGAIAHVQAAIHDHVAIVALGGRVVQGLVIKTDVTTPSDIGAVVVVASAPATRTVLDGSLQGSLVYPHWRFASILGALVAFENNQTAGLAWLQPATDKTPDAAHHTTGSVVVQSSPTESQRMLVDSPGAALLARSEGYSPGWSAKLTPVDGGATRVLPVHRFGLIQEINLPEGHFEVTWTYAPKGITVGLIITIASFVVFGGLFVLVVLTKRRRSPR